jgi:hypothetical protein
MGDEMNDDSKSDQQRLSNGNRVSASTYDIHRGDDFYKKLMFYEKNSSTNNNGHHQSTVNSPRRSSFQQSLSSSSSTSANKIVNGHTSRQTQQLISRPNPSKQSSLTTNNITDRMQRSKSYKDLFDPPSTNAQLVYYQQPSFANPNPSIITTTIANNSNNLFPYYSSSFYYQNNNNGTNPTSIVGSMLGSSSSNGTIEQHNHLTGLTEFQRRQQPLKHSSSSNNLLLDDVSSSSTVSHLPKPPPGIPSQNARYFKTFFTDGGKCIGEIEHTVLWRII